MPSAKNKTGAASVRSKVGIPELVEKRRAQFIEAAIPLFGKRGYYETTIRDIAREAKLSTGLIYQYVDDKEDVLFLALLSVLDSYKRQIPLALAEVEGSLARFCSAVRAYCEVNDRNVNATVLAYRETKSLRRERRLVIQQKELETNALISACIRECISDGMFGDVDVDLMTYQTVMFCHTWALKAWHFRRTRTLREYVDGGLTLILGGALTARGKRALTRINARAERERSAGRTSKRS